MKTSNINIHEIIDEATKKKDRFVTLYFGDEGISVSIYPLDNEPKRIKTKSGTWKKQTDPHDCGKALQHYLYVCSQCGKASTMHYDYCPHCTTKMEGIEKL